MDTKVTLETSATVTPAISLHHDSPGESIEMTVLNQSQNGETQSELPKSIAGVEDDPAAVRREMIAMASVCWTQFMVIFQCFKLRERIDLSEHFRLAGTMELSAR